MSGHRQAALALHAVSKGDQEAVLAELPAADQQVLRAHLQELTALGFDAEVVRLASSEKYENQFGNLPDSVAQDVMPDDHRLVLRRASAALMFEILGHEPASLIAQLLSLEVWPWAADFLDNFAPNRRAVIVDAYDGHNISAVAKINFMLEIVATSAWREMQKKATALTPVAQQKTGLSWFKQKVLAWMQ